jgi:hypothetical protein
MNGGPGGVENRVALLEVEIALDRRAVTVFEVTEALVYVPRLQLGQGDEVPGPRKRHARAGLPRDFFGPQRVRHARVSTLIEGG